MLAFRVTREKKVEQVERTVEVRIYKCPTCDFEDADETRVHRHWFDKHAFARRQDAGGEQWFFVETPEQWHTFSEARWDLAIECYDCASRLFPGPGWYARDSEVRWHHDEEVNCLTIESKLDVEQELLKLIDVFTRRLNALGELPEVP